MPGFRMYFWKGHKHSKFCLKIRMYVDFGKCWLIKSKGEICLRFLPKTAFFVLLQKQSNFEKKKIYTGSENILKELPSLQEGGRDGMAWNIWN